MAETAPKATKADKRNQYEAMFLLGASAAAEAEKSVQLIRSIIERHGGEVLVAKKWDERKLAYEIKKQKRGLYVITYFTAPGNAVTAIERDVNLSEDVLRVMVTDAEHMNKDEMSAVEPQPIVPREDRAPWDRPGFNDDGRRGPRRDDRRDDRGPRGGDRRDDRGPRDERGGRGGDEKPAAAGDAGGRE